MGSRTLAHLPPPSSPFQPPLASHKMSTRVPGRQGLSDLLHECRLHCEEGDQLQLSNARSPRSLDTFTLLKFGLLTAEARKAVRGLLLTWRDTPVESSSLDLTTPFKDIIKSLDVRCQSRQSFVGASYAYLWPGRVQLVFEARLRWRCSAIP